MEKQLEALNNPPAAGENAVFARPPIEYPPAAAEEQELLYDNGLGGFRPDGREYILRLGKGNTPAPWINVIANPNFGFICSESGSGYTWCENSHEYRLTPWSNDAVSDPPGEVIYLSDRETGRVFTPTALPIRDGGDYGARHGFGYSVFTHECYGISQTLTQFVPVRDAAKISLLTVKNTTGKCSAPLRGVLCAPRAGCQRPDHRHARSNVSERVRNADDGEPISMRTFPVGSVFMDCSIRERSV